MRSIISRFTCLLYIMSTYLNRVSLFWPTVKRVSSQAQAPNLRTPQPIGTELSSFKLNSSYYKVSILKKINSPNLSAFLLVVQLMMQIKFNFNNFARVCHSLAACQRDIRRRRRRLWLAYPIMTSLRSVRNFVNLEIRKFVNSFGYSELAFGWKTRVMLELHHMSHDGLYECIVYCKWSQCMQHRNLYDKCTCYGVWLHVSCQLINLNH